MRKLGTAAKWGGAALAVGFVAAAKTSVDTTNDLTKSTLLLTKNFGVSGKAASEWAGVARARGADATKLGMAFKTLASQISGAAAGSETSIAMFKALGFTQRDIQKSMTDTQFAVGKVAAGFEDLPPGMQKADLAGKLFGRGWQTIFPILRDGRAAMQDQLDTVEKYGGVIAGKTLKQQEDFLAAQRESKIAWQGMQVTLGTALTPALETVNEQFQKIAQILASGKLTDDQKFKKVSQIIQRDFDKVSSFVIAHLDDIASKAGQAGWQIAKGLVTGFLHADVWGKVAIAGFLITKMGGWSAIGGLGSKIGTRIGGGINGGLSRSVGGGSALAGAGGVTAVMAALALGIKALDDSLQKASGDTKQIGRMGEAISHLTKVGDDLADAGPKDLRTFTSAYQKLADSGADISGDLGHSIHDLLDRYGTFANAGRKMSRAQKNAWIDFATQAEQDGQITIQTLQKLTDGFDHASRKWKNNMQDVAKVTGDSTQKVKSVVGDMSVKVSKDYAGLVQVTAGGMTVLAKNTNDLLGKLGVKQQIEFHANPAAMHGPSGGTRAGLQTGGRIVPGMGSGDKVPAMLEPGEFVLNREAVKGIGQARLESMNKAIPRFAKGGVIEQALGPYTIPPIMYDPNHAGGNSHVHADFFTVAQALAYGHKAQGMGWSVGEYTPSPGNPFNFGPITTSHQSPGHYDGTAWDANTAQDETRSQVAAIAKLFNSGVAGGASAAVEKLKRIILEGPKGPLRDMGQAALDKTWHAANTFLARQAPSMTTTGKDFPTGAGVLSRGEMRGLLKAHGLPDIFGWIAEAESALNPNAIGHDPGGTTGYGLWQITSGFNDALINRFSPILDPNNNASAAAVLSSGGQNTSPWNASSPNWASHVGQAYRKGGMVMPPFAGSFGDGGVVPGPMGAARTIVAHGGETVGVGGGDPIINVHVHLKGSTAALFDFIDSRVDVGIEENDRHHTNLARMGR